MKIHEKKLNQVEDHINFMILILYVSWATCLLITLILTQHYFKPVFMFLFVGTEVMAPRSIVELPEKLLTSGLCLPGKFQHRSNVAMTFKLQLFYS